MRLYLRTKFQVSSITLMIFRQGGRGLGNFTHPPPQNKPLKSPPRLGFKSQFFSGKYKRIPSDDETISVGFGNDIVLFCQAANDIFQL